MTGLFKWNARKVETPAAAPAAAAPPPPADTRTHSKVFPRFLAALAHQPAPVLLDLGPVIGSNIAFFGDRLSCKIHVEDLFAEVETQSRRRAEGGPPHVVGSHLPDAPESIDGILCWDLFDFLDRSAGQTLARRLATLLRKGGALYGLFGTTPVDLRHYTRFIVESEEILKHRPYPATLVRRNVLVTRDIIKMFDGLVVADTVLLKSSARETLFRKP